MTPEQTLYAALTAGSPTSAIEEIVGDRIYPAPIPVGQPVPAIAYQKVGSEPFYTIHSNVAVSEATTFDVFCLADDHGQAEQIANLVAVLNSDQIRVISRSSTKGDEEDAPFASIVTLVVEV